MDFESIIERNYPRQEHLYWTGYYNSEVERMMLSSEASRKGMKKYLTNPVLHHAVNLFQKQFIYIIDKTFTVEEAQFYTSVFSRNDKDILDNI